MELDSNMGMVPPHTWQAQQERIAALEAEREDLRIRLAEATECGFDWRRQRDALAEALQALLLAANPGMRGTAMRMARAALDALDA